MTTPERPRFGGLRPGRQRRWFLLPVALGLLVLALTLILAPGPTRTDREPAPPLVRALVVTPADVVPQLSGHGEIRAERTWQGVAQVAGRITGRNPALRVGAWLPADTLLIELDPRDYQLALDRAHAQQRAASAALAELAARARDLTVARDLEAQALAIATRDYGRREQLAGSGHIAAIELDAEQQRLLRQRQVLQNLEAQLNLLPTQREMLQAQIAEAATLADRAREDLARTRLYMPFDGRIVEVRAEESQFVPTGQVVVVAATTGRVEAVLEVPMEQLVSRFPSIMRAHDTDALSRLRVDIRYQAGDLDLEWNGRVMRLDPALNPQSRAARVFIDIDPDPAHTAPAALSAASRVPGLTMVSPSIAARPIGGIIPRMRSTCAAGWASSRTDGSMAGDSRRNSGSNAAPASAFSIARSRSGRSG